MLIQQTVEAETVWKQIEPNLSFFCRDTTFEGGFDLPAKLNFISSCSTKDKECTRAQQGATFGQIYCTIRSKLRPSQAMDTVDLLNGYGGNTFLSHLNRLRAVGFVRCQAGCRTLARCPTL